MSGGFRIRGFVRAALALGAVAALALPGLWATAADPQRARLLNNNLPRSAAPVPTTTKRTCSAEDIEGAWYRADGTALRVSTLNLDGGRDGVFTVHPRAWPRGQGKYSDIIQVEGCTFQAICVDARRQPDDSFAISRAVCALTLDLKAGTLSQGAGYVFSRTPSMSAEAEGRRDAEAELDVQDRASEALNAEVTRRNAEAAARDQAKADAFARQQREYEARKKGDAAAYARAQAEYEREKAAVEAQRQRELRAWEAQVAACKAGDQTACAPK